MLLPTQIPITLVSIEFHRESRTSRAVSADPRSPATVEKRTNTGVTLPSLAKGAAFVYLDSGL